MIEHSNKIFNEQYGFKNKQNRILSQSNRPSSSEKKIVDPAPPIQDKRKQCNKTVGLQSKLESLL